PQSPTPDRVLQHVRPTPMLNPGDRHPRPQPNPAQSALKPRKSTKWSCRSHPWCWQSRFFSWFRPYSHLPQKYCKHTEELPNKYQNLTAIMPHFYRKNTALGQPSAQQFFEVIRLLPRVHG